MAIRRVKLTRDVIIKGHGHCQKGEEFELPAPMAAALIGDGSAVYSDDKPATYSTVHIERAEHGDPAPRRVSEKAPDKPKVAK